MHERERVSVWLIKVRSSVYYYLPCSLSLRSVVKSEVDDPRVWRPQVLEVVVEVGLLVVLGADVVVSVPAVEAGCINQLMKISDHKLN